MRGVWVMLWASAGMLSLVAGVWLCACCPLPEALYLLLLTADFSPVFLVGGVWLLALWCLSLVGCVGLGLFALDEIAGVLTQYNRFHCTSSRSHGANPFSCTGGPYTDHFSTPGDVRMKY
jgi:hypothetical protein